MKTILLMCLCPVRRGKVDEMYQDEYEAAFTAGFDVHLIDHDKLIAGNTDGSLRGLEKGAGRWAYRGWMISASVYGELCEALLERGFHPNTSAAAYKQCHHLPEWFDLFSSVSPASAWNTSAPPFSQDSLMSVSSRLPDGPAIVKDYVKSEKQD